MAVSSEDEYEKLNKSFGTKSEGKLVMSRSYSSKVRKVDVFFVSFSITTASQLIQLKIINKKVVMNIYVADMVGGG